MRVLVDRDPHIVHDEALAWTVNPVNVPEQGQKEPIIEAAVQHRCEKCFLEV